MKQVIHKIWLMVALLILPTLVIAADQTMPEVMVGQTTVTVQDPTYPATIAQTFYGGLTGNESVLNYVAPGQTIGKEYPTNIKFDGLNGYLKFADNPIFRFNNSYTISLWFKSNDSNGGTLLQKSAYDTSGQQQYLSYSIDIDATNKLTAKVWSNSVLVTLTAPNAVNANQWNQVAFTRSGNSCYLYVNGALVAGTNGNLIDAIGRFDTNPLFIGGGVKSLANLVAGTPAVGTDSAMFNGSIAEVRMYNASVNVGDIYNGKENDTSLAAHWDFSEGSGTIVHDRTYGHYDGTLVGTQDTVNHQTGQVDWRSGDGPAAPTEVGLSTSQNGYDTFGFNQDYLLDSITGCLNGIILGRTLNRCFVSNAKSNTNISVMTSRTYVGSAPETPANEIATLLYPLKPLLVGDAYLGATDPSNFAYWGRNLVQSSGTASEDSFIGLNHLNDTNAQAKLSGTEFNKFKAKTDVLKGEAVIPSIFNVGAINPATWYLQPNDNDITINSDGSAKYPDGRIWKSLSALDVNNGQYYYSGKGTIIVQGNLTINAGGANIDRLPGDNSSRLGIIVYGNVIINAPSSGNANTNIRAAIFALGSDSAHPGTITINGNNVNLLGSFVASDFIGLTNHSNIHFYYDPALDSAWPPGFRDLKMPHPVE